MKIGILSDAHLFHKNSQIKLYKKAITDLQNKVDIIVDCGDLTDKNIINASQAEELRTTFKDISIPFHIVKGNHDALNDVSVSSILSMNSNIIVHNDVNVIDFKGKQFLFIPYTEKAKDIYIKLKKLDLISPADYAFSHLNVTSNFYSTISFDKLENLFLYSNIYFNGHIHTPEAEKSLFGSFYNVGSFSSLTYGDEHVPYYIIYDTETDSFEKFLILENIIHKTIKIDNTTHRQEIDNYVEKYDKQKINWRIQITTEFSAEDRQELKNHLKTFNNTNNIQFSYVQNKQQKKEKISNNDYNNVSMTMIQQLFQQFEGDKNTKLDDSLKTELEDF